MLKRLLSIVYQLPWSNILVWRGRNRIGIQYTDKLLAFFKQCGPGFSQKLDQGLCTSNEGRSLKLDCVIILDNFKAFFFIFILVSDVLCKPQSPGSGFYLKYSYLKISLRSRYRSPDPVFWPKPDPHPWLLNKS